MSVTVKLDTSKLNQILATLPNGADVITKNAAFLIQQQTMMNIQRWPLIDTGALLSSWDVKRIKKGWWEIRGGMEYGVYWELGHKNIFMHRYVRKPFLSPAIQYVSALFGQMLANGLLK